MAYMEKKLPGYGQNYIIKNKQDIEKREHCANDKAAQRGAAKTIHAANHDAHKSAHMFCNHDTALGKSYCQYHELMKVREKVAVTAVKRFVMPTTQLRVFA